VKRLFQGPASRPTTVGWPESAARPQQSPGFEKKKFNTHLFVIVREPSFGIIGFE
jgi:hypothetical protein